MVAVAFSYLLVCGISTNLMSGDLPCRVAKGNKEFLSNIQNFLLAKVVRESSNSTFVIFVYQNMPSE